LTSFGVFLKMIYTILLICLKVHTRKISDKTDNSLLNYSRLFWSPLFIQTVLLRCLVHVNIVMVDKTITAKCRVHFVKW